MASDSPDALKIGYTEEEYQWAEENVYMWQYFVEQEILFGSDSRLPARFLILRLFPNFI